MAKRPPRARRGRATTSRPLEPALPENRGLLARILNTPHLAHVVPQLSPEVLHRVIDHCGLEDCGEIVALATPEQLVGVFDLDLWRAGEPGLDEHFDAGRFGVWLEVLVECGDTVAARTLADMDADLVATALAEHIRVVDQAAGVRTPGNALTSGVGGYQVIAKRAESWDAIVAALLALNVEHPDAFHAAMRGCRSLSNSAPELDGLDDLLAAGDQAMFDLSIDRERRRDRQGFVTPAQSRAFLQMAREPGPAHDGPSPENPVARAYFRSLEWAAAVEPTPDARRLAAASGAPPASEDVPNAVAALADLLLEAGVLPREPRALLGGAPDQAPRLACIRAQLQVARDREPDVYLLRSQELAYLANTLLAGCGVQARPLTPQEASEAAVAVCNLGLETWPLNTGRDPLPEDFLVGHDMVSVFQAGWAVLHRDVSVYTAKQLVTVLKNLRCGDGDTQAGLDSLRIELTKWSREGTPWRALDALDVLTALDMPAWAVLLGLMGQCPVIHAGLAPARNTRALTIDPSAFEFIANTSQIASVHDFLRRLPEILRP